MSKSGNEKKKMKRKAYEAELRKLQVKLCHLQEWVKAKGLRVIIAFEGRDAAGKGGTIRALTERVSPRVFRVVALPAPTERQKSQMFLQRYVERFPAGGEIVIFDRSWYNRAGVEHDLGANYDVTAWRRLARTLFKQYAEPLSVCPNHFAMSGRRLTVDRQLKNTR